MPAFSPARLVGRRLRDKFSSANNSNLKVFKASVDGNWMIPPVQLAAADKVLSILSQVDSPGIAAYQKSADAYKKRIQAKETDIKARLAKANVASVKVIASARQADFLKWAGLNVVASFDSPRLTPQKVKDLVDQQGGRSDATITPDGRRRQSDCPELSEKLNLSTFAAWTIRPPGKKPSTATWISS
jgi:hypothetical protein